MPIDRSVSDAARQLHTGGGGNSDFKSLVFKPEVQYRFAKSDDIKQLAIAPAFGDPSDPYSWTHYREIDNEQIFTRWFEAIPIYGFVGKRANIISPKIFDRNAQDPMGRILEVCRANPEFHELAGLGPDGKRDKENQLWKKALVGRPETSYIVNALCLNPEKEEDRGTINLWQIKETAFTGARGSTNWGIISQFNLLNRNADSLSPDEFPSYSEYLRAKYYWGDPTDPQTGLVVCKLSKAKSPTGGNDIWNMVPDDKAKPVFIDQNQLGQRVVLEDALLETPTSELVELMFELFADYPRLLDQAFSGSFPGVENMLKKTGVVSQSRVHTPSSPVSAPVRQAQAAPAAPVRPSVAARQGGSVQAPGAPAAAQAPQRTFAPQIPPASAAKPAGTPATPAMGSSAIERSAAAIMAHLDEEDDVPM